MDDETGADEVVDTTADEVVETAADEVAAVDCDGNVNIYSQYRRERGRYDS